MSIYYFIVAGRNFNLNLTLLSFNTARLKMDYSKSKDAQWEQKVHYPQCNLNDDMEKHIDDIGEITAGVSRLKHEMRSRLAWYVHFFPTPHTQSQLVTTQATPHAFAQLRPEPQKALNKSVKQTAAVMLLSV